MAKSNNKAAVFLNLVLLLSLLLIINTAESRLLGTVAKAKSTPECISVYGQQEGDTCLSISQAFNLTLDFFIEINPNLNCDKIFVGQWLCVKGSAN